MPKPERISSFNLLKEKRDMTYLVVENRLNPHRHHLSKEAKQRLRWMYTIEVSCDGNVSRAAEALNVSREWLSKLHTRFEQSRQDPRSLEPFSRAPHDRSKRKRISKSAEELVVAVRKKHPAWGKEKVSRILKRDYDMIVSPTTVGRYLKKHHLVSPKLSTKNVRAWKTRKEREGVSSVVRIRPPVWLADAAPGALIQKDMKFVGKPGSSRISGKERKRDYFWYQQTMIDTLTRMRVLSLTKHADSKTVATRYKNDTKRFPFPVASMQTDNGGENEKEFSILLQEQRILQFWSRPGTPTDNPRVERSHRTDDDEFYNQGNRHNTFEKQAKAMRAWETTYNTIRPHQALGYLTPIEYFQLWQTDNKTARCIQQNWKQYLQKQSKRQSGARREKRQDQLMALNNHLAVTLGSLFTPVKL